MTVEESEQTRDDLYFSETHSDAVVNARINDAVADARLSLIMKAATRHLHAFIKEVEPTHDEWLAGLGFLTRVGQMCSDWRQEYILLSDVLGVSMLVDAINNRRPSGATENTILGPFYVVDPPQRANGDTICLDGLGEPLVVRGRVSTTSGEPLANASVDVWQTNGDGFYDIQQKGLQPAMNMRGVFRTDQDGHYWFRSVRPRFYPIPSDGPVGQLLRTLGRQPNRAAHIHVVVSAEGWDTVITHIFEPNCPYLNDDAVFGVKASLIGDFKHRTGAEAAGAAGFAGIDSFWEVEADFVLAPSTGRKAFIHQV